LPAAVPKQFPADGTLARLNSEFKRVPKFLTALVSMAEDSVSLAEMRDSLRACGSTKFMEYLRRLQPDEAFTILGKFLSVTGRNIPGDNPKALPKGMGKVLFALANLARSARLKLSEPLKSIVASFLAALDRKAEFIPEGSAPPAPPNPGKMSTIRRASLDGVPGFFKSCFDIGSKGSNLVPDQAQRGGFSFKNALIAERNELAYAVAEGLGFPGRCARACMATLDAEVGLFSEEVAGSMVADVRSDTLRSFNDGQKISLIRQLLQMEAIDAITGEMDPNSGNVKLDVTGENVCLAAYDRDYGFGEIKTLAEAFDVSSFFITQLPFSSKEVLDAVARFRAERYPELVARMNGMGFPQKQVEAMSRRVEELERRLENLNAAGKIASNDEDLLTLARGYVTFRPPNSRIPRYENRLLRIMFAPAAVPKTK
jgi:hypothetical protein